MFIDQLLFRMQWTIVWRKNVKSQNTVHKPIRKMNTIESEEANIHIEQWKLIECDYCIGNIVCFFFPSF